MALNEKSEFSLSSPKGQGTSDKILENEDVAEKMQRI